MRISIIGPSASGKTTLAKKLADYYDLKHMNLDYILFKNVQKKKRLSVPEDKYMKAIEKFVKQKDWIVEGVNTFDGVFEPADVIIWIKPPLLISLYRQWKRYFVDSRQRAEHGFINNLKLTIYIIRQYIGKPTPQTDPKGTWIRSVEKILMKYKNKTIILRNSSNIDDIVKMITS